MFAMIEINIHQDKALNLKEQNIDCQKRIENTKKIVMENSHPNKSELDQKCKTHLKTLN